MFSRLRVNIEYKLLALVCAIALHYYVVSQTHPVRSRTLVVALYAKNIPDGMLFDPPSVIPINITVEGPSEDLDRLSQENISAFVDLKNAHSALNTNLVVHYETNHIGTIVVTDIQPQRVSVNLSLTSHRSLPITPTYPGTPPVGYSFRMPVISPSRASVSGSREAVDSVVQLVVNPASPGDTNAVNGDFPIVAFDADGHPVSDISIVPASVHVRIGVSKVPATKAVLVSPTIVGSTLYPNEVVSIQTYPDSIKISGMPSVLSSVSTVGTEPIDVSGATSTIVRRVRVIAPAGTTIDSATVAQVTVHISPLAVPSGVARPPVPAGNVPPASPIVPAPH